MQRGITHRRKRRLTDYAVFMQSFLRARTRPGMSQTQRKQLMRDGAAAWQRAKRGRNPFPDVHIDFVEGDHNFHGAGEGEIHGSVEAVACPECGEALEVPESAAGQTVACPECGATFEVEIR